MFTMLAACLLASPAAAQTQPEYSGDPDVRGTDPQPTEAEVTRRLEMSGAAKGSVDTSPAIGQEVDQLYKQLMKDTAPPSPPPPQPR
jgi:hypothetical protein